MTITPQSVYFMQKHTQTLSYKIKLVNAYDLLYFIMYYANVCVSVVIISQIKCDYYTEMFLFSSNIKYIQKKFYNIEIHLQFELVFRHHHSYYYYLC